MSGVTITANRSGYFLNNSTLNPVTVNPDVTISDPTNPALGSILSTYWSIVNSGTLLSTGTHFYSDGIFLQGGTLGQSGGGAVTNTGAGSITGLLAGVYIHATGTVINQGSITAKYNAGYKYLSAGVDLGGGGVSNASTGLIDAYYNGVALQGAGSVVNSGSIAGTGTAHGHGVLLDTGGYVSNTLNANISGGDIGVLAGNAPGTVVNSGTISDSALKAGAGVQLFQGGSVTNNTGGIIQSK